MDQLIHYPRKNKAVTRRHTSKLALLICVLLLGIAQETYAIPLANLAGYWRFALDRDDAGVTGEWFKTDLRNMIKLPGVLQAQGFGDDISTKTPWVLSLYDRNWFLREDYKAYTRLGNVKVPFLSQPPRHYLGVAWYQQQILIPPRSLGRRIVLTLERPHWETTVWVDGQKIGSNKSLVAPHVYDFGLVTPGRHRLTIRVDNRMLMPYRPDAHSVSDSLAGSWNGIVGNIELSETGRVWIDDVQAFPNLKQRSMVIKVRIGNQTGRSGSGTITAIWPDLGIVPVNWDEHGAVAEIEVPLRFDAQTWDEFSPYLHPLRIWLKGVGVDEYFDLKVGLRDFRAQGKQFLLNDKPIIFRGTHSGGDFPMTGYPPTDVASWKKLFETCRAWGLNHMRFHSWAPPEAAFEAADQIGFYLQPEPGMWNEISPDTPMEQMLYEETDRMIKAYGNHPSFMLFSASNEPKGRWKESLSKWVEHYRKQDPRRLYTSGTGHTDREIPNITEGTDYLAIQRIGQKMLRRESAWFGGDYGLSLEDVDVPVISHEVGQWAAYPDFDIIKKFSGYMRPGNFEIFRDSLKAKGLLEKNRAFSQASGAFQLISYKEEIEANLRTPGLSGFQLLDLHDYAGQGTALVGLLDAFWEPKGYVTAEAFRQFCNTTVPLARLRQRVFTTTDSFDVELEAAHFGPEPIEDGVAVWRVTIGSRIVAEGESTPKTIPIGKNISLGRASVNLATVGVMGEYRLTVTLAPALFFGSNRKIRPGPGVVRGTTYFENEWNFWVYPTDLSALDASSPSRSIESQHRRKGVREPSNPTAGNPDCPPSRNADVLVTSSWEEAEAKLATGGKVLFAPRNADLDWTSPPLDTVPIFWNRLMGPAWGRMLGLWIDLKLTESKSYMMSAFPTSSNFDWQWAQIMQNVRAVNMDQLPAELEPVVWAIDDWNRNYKLGVLFEAAVGDGRLLVSAFDVTKPGGPNAVARQLRYSLLSYIKSDCFQPNVSVTPAEIRSLLFDTRIMSKLGAVARESDQSANNVIDGDPNTFLLVGDQRVPERLPVDIFVSFPEPVAMSGLVLMPRQNHREHEGDIREYVIQISDDGNDWREVVRGELASTFAPQRIEFPRTVTGKHLKLISLSGFGNDKTTALAELAVIYAGPKFIGANGTIEYQRSRTATPEIDEGPAPEKKTRPTPTPARPPRP